MSSVLRAGQVAEVAPPAAAPFLVPGVSGVRQRVVKAGDVEQRVAQAAQQASTAATVQAAVDAARAEGHAAGLAAGRQEALDNGSAAGPRVAAALEQLVAQSSRLHAEDVAVTSEAVLEAAIDVAEWVLQADPTQASASLLPRLTAAARTLAPGPRTVVRVSPHDLEAVTEWAREGVEVVPDGRLAPGEARMDRGEGTAVLTFAAALRRAAKTLGVTE